MMLIDMTAELSSLMVGLNVLLAVAGAAVLASVLRSASFASQPAAESKLAVVGSSSSAPAPAEDAPSDTSVPEAA